jgi:hypothetical protein
MLMKKEKDGIRVMVWFDRPRDCLCFADRVDEIEKDHAIPDERAIRIPLTDCEDFIDAVMNASGDRADFWKTMDGIQVLLDGRAAKAIQLAERLRLEWSKRSGGGAVQRNMNEVTVRADEWIRLQEMREKVVAFLGTTEGKAPELESLENWINERGLDEPGRLPKLQAEAAKDAGKIPPGDQDQP